MRYWRRGYKDQPKNPAHIGFLVSLLLICIISGILVQAALAVEQKKDQIESGPDVAIVDASVKMNISEMDDIPLGTIPDETLVVSITVQNTGNREAPGYKLRTYLVRVGREDEIGAQIGGDITDTRLGPGETRTYSKSWALPTHLKKGEYRMMVFLDTSNFFIEPDTDNNRIISQQKVVPGSMTGPEGSIPVYSSVEITEPGYYVLKRDIDGGKKINIFEIKSSGVTFDGGGNTIRGIPSGFTTGIYIDAGNAVRDIVIKNLVVEDVDAGIWMVRASAGRVENCTFRNTKNMGLRLDQSHQNEITGSTFEHNSIGIGVFESKDNIIYNNLFKNEHNAVVNDNKKNNWNTDLKSGVNIIGGSMVGGNAWFDESGEGGFSSTAQDYTHDGISEAPYSLNPSNIDLYPLTSFQGITTTTVIPESTEKPEENKNFSSSGEENMSDTELVLPVDVVIPLPLEVEAEPTWIIDEITEEPIINQSGDKNPEESLNESFLVEENITDTRPVIPVEIVEPLPKEINVESDQIEEMPTEEPADKLNTDIKSENSFSQYADIGVKGIIGAESGCPGTEFNISVIIENTGGYDADSFQVRFYLSDNRQIDSEDILLDEKTIKNLLSGTEQKFNETFTIPELIGLKNYYIAMVTNTDNSVFEDKKDNNTGFSSVRMSIREC